MDDSKTQIDIFNKIVKQDLSVRKIEEHVRKLNLLREKASVESIKKLNKLPEEYNQLKEHLSKYFKTEIEFKINTRGKGKIVIPFSSDEELEQIIGILDKVNI